MKKLQRQNSKNTQELRQAKADLVIERRKNHEAKERIEKLERKLENKDKYVKKLKASRDEHVKREETLIEQF
jgi:hypothetical protein